MQTGLRLVTSAREAQQDGKDIPRRRLPLGRLLTEDGAVAPGHLLKAAAIRTREEARLGEVLLARGWVTEPALLRALARQWHTACVDPAAEPPDPRLIDRLGTETCLRRGLTPWRRIGGETVVACAHPEEFDRDLPLLRERFGPCRMVVASGAAIQKALLSRRQTELIRKAETSVPETESCRGQIGERAASWGFGLLLAAAASLILAPMEAFALLFGWVMLTLIASTGLKVLAAGAEIRAITRLHGPADCEGLPLPPPPAPIRLSKISLLVPLFHEADIAPRLIERLGRLDYPPELTDILLIVEEEDRLTREALDKTPLPVTMRVVIVPDGPVRTKPRAMNYALAFCRGSIIGIYDAEDRPDRDQLQIVARRFAAAAPDVACLQGVLDYYNPCTNWLSRCFTIEYAAWFRAFLPGLARLGLVVPLGGTTLFFRRKILEEIGAWDAWNVTEDADLGLRLARRGYRTELIPTVTQEEANCRPLPWVRQRSRWLKGFAMTWAVHMRDPIGLWRDLGPKRFFGVQALLLASFSQYLLAPLLWSCWLLFLGLGHPLATLLPHTGVLVTVALFAFSEVANIAIGAWSVRGAHHRHLIPWAPTMHLYFPLGTLAGWKAVYEVVTRPFYWDKTAHGVFSSAGGSAPERAVPATVPVTAGRIAQRSPSTHRGSGEAPPFS